MQDSQHLSTAHNEGRDVNMVGCRAREISTAWNKVTVVNKGMKQTHAVQRIVK